MQTVCSTTMLQPLAHQHPALLTTAPPPTLPAAPRPGAVPHALDLTACFTFKLASPAELAASTRGPDDDDDTFGLWVEEWDSSSAWRPWAAQVGARQGVVQSPAELLPSCCVHPACSVMCGSSYGCAACGLQARQLGCPLLCPLAHTPTHPPSPPAAGGPYQASRAGCGVGGGGAGPGGPAAAAGARRCLPLAAARADPGLQCEGALGAAGPQATRAPAGLLQPGQVGVVGGRDAGGRGASMCVQECVDAQGWW